MARVFQSYRVNHARDPSRIFLRKRQWLAEANVSNEQVGGFEADLNGSGHEFVKYPRENHCFIEPRHIQDRWQRYLVFFGKYLDNPPVTEDKDVVVRLAKDLPAGNAPSQTQVATGEKR